MRKAKSDITPQKYDKCDSVSSERQRSSKAHKTLKGCSGNEASSESSLISARKDSKRTPTRNKTKDSGEDEFDGSDSSSKLIAQRLRKKGNNKTPTKSTDDEASGSEDNYKGSSVGTERKLRNRSRLKNSVVENNPYDSSDSTSSVKTSARKNTRATTSEDEEWENASYKSSRSGRQLRNRSSLKKSNVKEDLDSNVSPSYGKSSAKKSGRAGAKTTMSDDEDSLPKTPVKNFLRKEYDMTPQSSARKSILVTTPKTPSSLKKTPKSVRMTLLTPTMPKRDSVASTPGTPLEEARARLHVSAVPQALPCRDQEFNNIYNFLTGKILDKAGGCMYISGVPGTGKTATVRQVVKVLQKAVEDKDLPQFNFVEINGMKMTEPRQAYVQILKALTNEKLTSDQALRTLEKRFTQMTQKKTTLLIVDELDLICNKRQDVVYNLLDWPSKAGSLLVVVTIANTMDLPETMLKGRVTSRLGLTRLTFKPYTYKQLQAIVIARLTGLEAFDEDAVQLVARKVASISGDARRALDICRRATEIAEKDAGNAQTNSGTPKKSRKSQPVVMLVTMKHVEAVMEEMVSSSKIQAIRGLSLMEKLFLRAVATSVEQCGDDQCAFRRVYHNMYTLAVVDGLKIPTITELLHISARLTSYRLILSEHSRTDTQQKMMLNADCDDIHYALNLKD